MKTTFKLALVASALALTGSAQGAITKPDSATASSFYNSFYGPEHTINGSGLPSPTDITAAHADYSFNNHWTSAFGANLFDQWIDWEYSSPVSVAAAYIWNHRSNNIADYGGYEPTLFDLTFFDSSNNTLATFNNLSLAPDNAYAQLFSFNSIGNVSRIRFDVKAVQGTPGYSGPLYTGLAEVAFDTTPTINAVPEPASWALMIAGFGAVGAAARRRAKVRVTYA